MAMYNFVDRPVAQLGLGGRFLLWAMRGWIQSASTGNCPPGSLAPAFAKHGVLVALPHFHRLMGEMNRRAKGTISFLPLNYCRIGEDEAVLLQLWRDATDAPPRAQATLGLLMEAEAVGASFSALLSSAARLGEAGLGEIGIAAAGVSGNRAR
jgi:hypothetical protein